MRELEPSPRPVAAEAVADGNTRGIGLVLRSWVTMTSCDPNAKPAVTLLGVHCCSVRRAAAYLNRVVAKFLTGPLGRKVAFAKTYLDAFI
jgi:hypothetical protein